MGRSSGQAWEVGQGWSRLGQAGWRLGAGIREDAHSLRGGMDLETEGPEIHSELTHGAIFYHPGWSLIQG